MIKNAIIDIKGTQENGGEQNVIEFNTEGRFGEKDGGYFISYDEGELSGMGKVKTFLYIRADRSVKLKRTGSFNSDLTIELGKRSSSVYRTPHGDMMIGIYGEAIEDNLSDDGGSFSMRYTVDSNLELLSTNSVDIKIKTIS